MKIVIELYKNEKVLKYPSFLELSQDKDKKPYEVEELVLKTRKSYNTDSFIYNEIGYYNLEKINSKFEDLKQEYNFINIYEDGELILEKELD